MLKNFYIDYETDEISSKLPAPLYNAIQNDDSEVREENVIIKDKNSILLEVSNIVDKSKDKKTTLYSEVNNAQNEFVENSEKYMVVKNSENERNNKLKVNFKDISSEIDNNYNPIIITSDADRYNSFNYYSVNYRDVYDKYTLNTKNMTVYKRTRNNEKNVTIRSVPIFDIRNSNLSSDNYKLVLNGFATVSNKKANYLKTLNKSNNILNKALANELPLYEFKLVNIKKDVDKIDLVNEKNYAYIPFEDESNLDDYFKKHTGEITEYLKFVIQPPWFYTWLYKYSWAQ